MKESLVIALVKILAPYFVAIIGILSPILTNKFLNKEELLKYKKQQNYTLIFETYSDIISKLYKLRRVIKEIKLQAEIFNDKLMPNLEYQNKEYIMYIAQKAVEYDDKIRELLCDLNKIIDDKYPYLKKEIINNIEAITNELDSALGIFSWGIPVMKIRKNETKITDKFVSYIYEEGKKFYCPYLDKIENVISILKYEVTGEK